MGKKGIKGMKLKEKQPDALQEGITEPGAIQVFSCLQGLGTVKGEAGGASPGDTWRFIRHLKSTKNTILVILLGRDRWVCSQNAAVQGQTLCPNRFLLIWGFRRVLHNKTPPGISPQPLALTCTPRRQGGFGLACTEE